MTFLFFFEYPPLNKEKQVMGGITVHDMTFIGSSFRYRGNWEFFITEYP